MDYEKAYKEALERAKEIKSKILSSHLSTESCKAVSEYIDEIIPELAESDDERIANALIRLLNNENVSSLITFEARQLWLDWLERKKIPSVSFNPALGFDPGSVVVYHNDESEDDSIRKAILGLTYLDGIEPILTKCSITRCEIHAYLERQKAKEQLDRMAPIYNDKESFESALEKAWKYYNESSSRTVDSFDDDYIECVFSKGFREGFLYKEKQKEQKPAEWKLPDDFEEARLKREAKKWYPFDGTGKNWPAPNKLLLIDTNQGKYVGHSDEKQEVYIDQSIHYNGPITIPACIWNKWKYIDKDEFAIITRL